MPRCGTALDENSPLLGGACAKGAGLGCTSLAKTHPVCLRQSPFHGRVFSWEIRSMAARSRTVLLGHLEVPRAIPARVTHAGCPGANDLERRWLHELIVKDARCDEASRLQAVPGLR